MRIAGACREFGLRSVAVYSQADAGALHVRSADAAVEIGPAEARLSYLNIESVLVAAKQSEAEAIHPGYGFLAENAEFAEAVIAAGLVWIGPPPPAMRAMGDKARARELMLKAGVPVLPGYQGKDDAASLKKAAADIRYPLLVKAAAGGGGVGQRVVNKADELGEAIASARREAKNAFNDERLILEKYFAIARHVEIQVLGDQHGTMLHLFERECSLQRRRQKIVEETPSPLMETSLRLAMCEAAVAAAKSVGYTNAGTVEFLVDPATRQFYFLEMNTRLQVEHPITELTTGLDIVQWQLRIAAGEKLSIEQADLTQRGHAIECRVYAEDADSGFLPQAGRVLKLRWPQGEGVRIDAGVGEGDKVGVHYDPMLAKLSVQANTREEAIGRMRAALSQTVVLGLTSNVNFLQDLLADKEVQAGELDTRFVERNIEKFTGTKVDADALIVAMLTEVLPVQDEQTSEDCADVYSPWSQPTGFRIGGR